MTEAVTKRGFAYLFLFNVDKKNTIFTLQQNSYKCSYTKCAAIVHANSCQLNSISSHWRCSVKKVFLNFRSFHRKAFMFQSLFNKVAVLKVSNFIKKKLEHKRFCVNITKFLRVPILKNKS